MAKCCIICRNCFCIISSNLLSYMGISLSFVVLSFYQKPSDEIASLHVIVNFNRSYFLQSPTNLFQCSQPKSVILFHSSYSSLLPLGSTSSSKGPPLTTSCCTLPLLKNPKKPFLFPSGLVPGDTLILDQTLDRRLEPSALVLTG